MNPTAHDFLLVAKARERAQLQDLLQIGQLTGRIAKLVHMLQRERGASNIWLCSGGRQFGEVRRVYAREVDQQIACFQQSLLQPEYLPGSGLVASLACALYSLEQLAALRERIASRQIDPFDAMEQFNTTLRHLLCIVPQTSSVVDEPGVAQALATLFSFMQGKELAGQERAIGALGLIRGEFDEPLRQQLVDRIDGQQHCFDTFYSMADEPLRERYRRCAEPCREMEQLRRQACTRLNRAEDASALVSRWFTLLTARIDALRDIEEMLIHNVLAQAQRALGQALNEPDISDDVMENFIAGVKEFRPGEHYLDRHLLVLVRQQAQQLESMARRLASLETTLAERKVIEKAKGLLIRHQGYSEEQAWQALRKMAMNQNKRMVEVAGAMVAVADIWTLPPKE